METGIRMIAAKMSNQAAVLKYFSKYRKKTNPESAAAMTQAAEKILELSRSAVVWTPPMRASGAVCGLLGHAAAIYWRQVAGLVPEEFGFGGRITFSAQDPVNQCFNYIYGLLYGEVWRAVVRAGLDPYFGLVHGSSRDDGSLVFDLIEEYRAPFGDRVVLGMFGRGFRPEIGRHGFLTTRSRRILVRAFTTRWTKAMRCRPGKVTPEKLLSTQASLLGAVFERKAHYHPYRMRW